MMRYLLVMVVFCEIMLLTIAPGAAVLAMRGMDQIGYFITAILVILGSMAAAVFLYREARKEREEKDISATHSKERYSRLSLEDVKAAVNTLHNERIKHYQEIGRLWGTLIVEDTRLADDEWRIVAGKKVYDMMKGGRP